jgi:hypothetical protein
MRKGFAQSIFIKEERMAARQLSLFVVRKLEGELGLIQTKFKFIFQRKLYFDVVALAWLSVAVALCRWYSGIQI